MEFTKLKLFLAITYISYSITFYYNKIKKSIIGQAFKTCPKLFIKILNAVCCYTCRPDVIIKKAYLDIPDNDITNRFNFCIEQYLDTECYSLSVDDLFIYNKNRYKKIIIEYIINKKEKKIELELNSIPFNEINF